MIDSDYIDKTQLQQILIETRQTLSEIKKNEMQLKDELESTKAKLKLAESQLQNSPRWMSTDVESSEIRFLRARNKVEIETLQSKILEKDKEIERLKKEMIPKSNSSILLKSVITSIQNLKINQSFIKLTKSNPSILLLLNKLTSISSESASFDETFQTFRDIFDSLSNVFVSIDRDSKHSEDILQYAQLKSLESQISEINSKNSNLQNELSSQRNQFLIIANKLYGTTYQNDINQNDYQKIISAIDKLLKYKDDNAKLTQQLNDLKINVLNTHDDVPSKYIFEKVVEKFHEYKIGYQRISQALNLQESNVDDIISYILNRHTDLQLETSKLSHTYDQLAASTSSMREQIRLLQIQLSNSERQKAMLQSEFRTESERNIQNRKEISTKQGKIDQLENQLANLLEKSAEVRSSFEQNLRAIENANMEAQSSKDLNNRLNLENKSLKSENKSLKDQLDAAVSSMESFKKKLRESEDEISRIREKLGNAAGEVRSVQEKSENELKTLREKEQEYKAQLKDAANEMKTSQNLMKKLAEKSEKQNQRIIKLKLMNKQLKEIVESKEKETQSLQDQLMHLSEKTQIKLRDSGRLKQEHDNLKFEESRLKGEVEALQTKMKELLNEKSVLFEKATRLVIVEKELQEMKSQFAVHEAQKSKRENDYAEAIRKYRTLEIEVESLRAENKSYKESLDKPSNAAQIDQLTKRVKELENENKILQNKIDEDKMKLSQYDLQLNQAKQDLVSFKSKVNDYSDIKQKATEAESLRNQLIVLRQENSKLQTIYDSKMNEYTNVLQKAGEADSMRAQIAQLRQKVVDYELQLSDYLIVKQKLSDNDKLVSMLQMKEREYEDKLRNSEENKSKYESDHAAMLQLSSLVRTAKSELVKLESETNYENIIQNLLKIFNLNVKIQKSPEPKYLSNMETQVIPSSKPKKVHRTLPLTGNASDLFTRLHSLYNEVENETENISSILQNSTFL